MTISNPNPLLKFFVWNKGVEVPGYNPAIYRKDRYGIWMQFTEYGNRDSKFGWEIDHIIPNDNDDPQNLQPLHWRNNVAKSDKYPTN